MSPPPLSSLHPPLPSCPLPQHQRYSDTTTYIIIRIENPGDVFSGVSAEDGLDVVAVIEVVQVEVLGRVGGPKQQSVARVVAVSRDRVVIGKCQDDVGLCPRSASVRIPAEEDGS